MSGIKNLTIIQARTGSTRLSNKVMLMLEGKTVLEHVINRVSKSKMIDELIVATTIEKSDLKIVELCAKLGIRVFCGSQNDVLDRYYQAAKLFSPQNVIRITADCPLIDYTIIDKIIAEHDVGGYDYTSNTLQETYPDGLDAEVMKFAVLKEAWEKAELASHREHVTQYIVHNDKYRKHNISSEKYYGDKRWTLDTEEDYIFIREIYKRLYSKNEMFLMQDVLDVIGNEPNLEASNKHIERNEGLIKSLENDFKV